MSEHRPAIPVAELARIGPYFALRAAGEDDAAGWRRASELIGDAEDLGQVIDEVAVRLRTSHRWIAASIFYQGWAARLTSVYAGSAALCGAVPDLGADRVRYRPGQSGPVELSVRPLDALPAEAGWRRLHDDHLDPLAAAIRRQVRIGRHLLRGNVAAALAGALSMLAMARQETLEAIIGHGWAQPAGLSRSGRWMPTPGGPRYARTTCCGYDQLRQGGRCGDCSLNWRA